MLVFLAEYGSLNIGVEHKGYVAYSFRFDDEFWEKTAAGGMGSQPPLKTFPQVTPQIVHHASSLRQPRNVTYYR